MSAKPIDPTRKANLKLLRWGALTVPRAVKFSGIGRSELFVLMRDGVLPWFKRGTYRMIPRRSLVEHLANLYEHSNPGAGART